MVDCFPPEVALSFCCLILLEADTYACIPPISTQAASEFAWQGKVVASWDVPSPRPDLPIDSVIDLHHSAETRTTCVSLAGGDVITVREADGDGVGAASVELVGSLDSGIAAAAWSPDGDLLAVATPGRHSPVVVLMGRSSFDPIAEVSMTSADLAASRHVSVGWGSRQTQFRGRGAAAAARRRRDPTIPEHSDQGLLSPHDDLDAVTLSWRGDGAFFAVSSVVQLGEGQEHGEQTACRRVIRVFTRDGALDSVSEPVDGLEASLSWRPSGNLIAALRRIPSEPDAAQVIFFERNGLRHGEFSLRDVARTRHHQLRLAWNHDSTVLAVLFDDRFQLWTMGNYHWYLKYEMPLPAGCSRLVWHPERALRMVTISECMYPCCSFSLSRILCLGPRLTSYIPMQPPCCSLSTSPVSPGGRQPLHEMSAPLPLLTAATSSCLPFEPLTSLRPCPCTT